MDDNRSKLLSERVRLRKYYHRNRTKVRERHARWRAEFPSYFKEWYKRNRDYQIAKMVLRRICRPDLRQKHKYQHRFPGLKADDLEFDSHTKRECDRLYYRMLSKLRKAFGRDLETGRRVSSADSG